MTPEDDCDGPGFVRGASRPSRPRIDRSITSGLLALLVLFGAVVPLVGAVAAADTPEFEESLEHTDQNEVAEITIAVPDGTAGPMTVQIGSEKVNFLVNATVVDADGDGAVILQLDIATAGKGEPDSYLSISEGDKLESAERVTPEIKPPLDAGDYDLALWFDDERVDIGTLVVASQETTTDPASGTNFVYEGETLTLSAAEEQVVRGETTLDPGTSVTLRMRSGGSSPFLKSVETTVSEDGTFEATFDMNDVAEGSEFTVSALATGSKIATTEGHIGCENDCPTTASTASPTTFPETTTESSDGGPLGSLGPLGALALGAVLAVVGVGVLLGVFRN